MSTLGCLRTARRLLLIALGVLFLWCDVGSHAAPSGPRWQVLRAPGLEICYSPEQERAARSAAAAAQDTRRRLAGELGVAADRPLTLFLHPTHAAFARAVGTKRRQMIVGIALGGASLAHVDASGAVADLRQVVAHEVGHLLLTQAVGGAEIPRWFDEGYAERAGGSLEWASRELLAETLATGRLFDLEQVSDTFPRDGQPAATAYSQSHALVEYLLRHAPEGALPDLVRRLRSGEEFETALAGATGRSSASWDADWRSDFQGGPRWHRWVAFVAGASGIVMALLCILAYRAILRRKEELPGGDDEEEFYGLMRPLPRRRFRLRRR